MSLITFLQLFITILTIFLLGISVYITRYSTTIYKFKVGKNCYKCGTLNSPKEDTSWPNHISFSYPMNPTLCKSCNRDVTIDNIDSKIKSKFNQIKYHSLNILNREGIRDYRKMFSFAGAAIVLLSIPAFFTTSLHEVFKLLIMLGNTCTSISLMIDLVPVLILNLKIDNE